MLILHYLLISISIILSKGETCHHKIAGTDYVDSLISHEHKLVGNLYPNKYRQCWLIETDNQHNHVKLIFVTFKLQQPDSNGNCYDALKIFDGKLEDESKLLGSYCGHHNGTAIMTNTTNLYITFTTDQTVTDDGFVIQFYSYVGVIVARESIKYTPLIIVGIIMMAILLTSVVVIIVLTCILNSHQRNKKNLVWTHSNKENVSDIISPRGLDKPQHLTTIVSTTDPEYDVTTPEVIGPAVYNPEVNIIEVRERSPSCSSSSSSSSSSRSSFSTSSDDSRDKVVHQSGRNQQVETFKQ